MKEMDILMRLDTFDEVDSNAENDKRNIRILNLMYNRLSLIYSENQRKNLNQSQNASSFTTNLKSENLNVSLENGDIRLMLKEIIFKQSRQKDDQGYRFVYLIYLLEVMDCMKSYWLEYAQLRKRKQSIKQEQILFGIHFHFLHQKQILQKTRQFQSLLDYTFQGVLQFEENIQQSFELLDLAMKSKVDLITIMKQKQIQASILLNQCRQLRNLQKQLRDELNHLAMINSQNSDLLSLQICYLENLSFTDKDILLGYSNIFANGLSIIDQSQFKNRQSKDFVKLNVNGNERNKRIKMDSNNKVQMEHIYYSQADLFDKNSCVIFAVVEDRIDLVFRKVSQNFTEIFGLSQQEVIGKNIEIIMPKSIPFASKHQGFLMEYFAKKELDHSSMLGKIIFGQTQHGNIIPLQIDIRLNYHQEIQDIGFCSQIRMIKDQSEYILFNQSSLSFLGMSSKLQTLIFSKQQVHKKFNVGQMFPFLYKISKNKPAQSPSQNLAKSNWGVGTEWEYSQSQDQFEFTNNPSESNRNPQALSNMKDEVLKRKLNGTFEFLLIIENKKDSITTINSMMSTNIMRFLNERDYQFFLMDIQICSANYKNLDSLSYLKITKIKSLTPLQNGPLIIQQIKEHLDMYILVFSKTLIDKIINDVENKYNKTTTLFESKNNVHNNNQVFSHSSTSTKTTQNSNNMKKLTSSIEKTIISNNQKYQNNEVVSSGNQNKVQNQQQINENNQINNNVINYNEAISNFNFQNNLKKNKQIELIIEEDQSVSSVSAHVSDQEEYNYKEVQDIDINSNKKFDPSTNNIIDQQLSPQRSAENINLRLGELKSQEAILSDNLRADNLLSEQMNGMFVFSEEELKVFSDRESFRNKQQSFQSFALLSPNMTAASHQDLLRNKQISLHNNSVSIDQIYNKRDSSSTFGNNLNVTNNANNNNNTQIMDNSQSTAAAIQQKFFQDRDTFAQNIYENAAEQKDINLIHSKKVKQLKEKHKQHLIDQQNENASTKSRETTTSTKRILTNIIKAQTKILAIKIINMIGLAAFITLVSVALQQYLSIVSSLQESQDNFAVQDWPQETQIRINRVMKNTNILALIRQNQMMFDSPAQQSSFDSLLLNRLYNSKDEFTDLLVKMESSTTGSGVFLHLGELRMKFQNAIVYFPGDKTGISSIRGDNYSETIDVSLLYSYILFNLFIFRQAINPNARQAEFYVVTNLESLIGNIELAQDKFMDIQTEQDVMVQTQLSNLIIIILLISGICISIILPLYGYIQSKKDSIIQLFCTFPASTLQMMVSKMRSSYYQNKYMSQHIKHIPLEIQNTNDLLHQKKQTMSSITKLPRINFFLLPILLGIYLLLSLYPIINKMLTQKYLDNQANNLSLFVKLNSVREFLQESTGMYVFTLVMQLYPTVKVVKIDQFLSSVDKIQNKTHDVLSTLQEISNEQSSTSRFNQQDYDSFFFPILEDDLCKRIETHPQYILNATKFQPDFCATIQNGFLKKGLKLSMKYFTTFTTDFYQIIKQTDPLEIAKAKQIFLKQTDIIDLFNLIDYLEETLNIMKSFIMQNSQEYFQFISDVQLALIIYQMILMVLAFGIGWNVFSQYLGNQITITKQYIQVINIYYLLDNNYILTFIKNNHKI